MARESGTREVTTRMIRIDLSGGRVQIAQGRDQLGAEWPARGETGRRRGHAGPDAAAEITSDAFRHPVGGAVELEAIEVEIEIANPLPEVGIVDVGAVGEQRIPELPERPLRLQRYSLRGGVQRRRARSFADDREMPHAELDRQGRDLGPGAGAARTRQIEVDDGGRARPAYVVDGVRLGYGGAPV